MRMSKYLYGASVQGIQEFIFATNQLREIVGASEIVKSLKKEFEDFTKEMQVTVLLNAAGNIKAIFKDKTACEDVVRDFAKKIQQKAYGITISQAVVKMEGAFATQEEAMKELEKKLKTQRSRPSLPLDMHINILKQSPKTARPIHIYKHGEPLDMATKQKRDAYTKWFNEKRKENPDFKELKEISALSNGKNKIAVIHADGNGLGQIVPKLSDKLSSFSVALETATQNAFNNAKTPNMKIREVILGGDDMTVICDANEALEFTRKFLENFETETQKIKELNGLKEKLTACAGIAFCNEKYPFHYAVHLAEALCSQTKKHAKAIDKELAPSSLMFHNIQSSNFQSWEKFVEDELTIVNDKETIRCDFGPYYSDENIEFHKETQPTIQDLLNTANAYRQEGSPISRLREWMGELHKSSQGAENLLKRINEITERSEKWKCEIMDKNLKKLTPKLCNQELIIQKEGHQKTPIYDILQIHSVTEAK